VRIDAMFTRIRPWLVAVLVAGATAPLVAGPGGQTAPPAPTNDVCLACHGDASAVGASGRSIAVDPAKFEASVHGALGLACVDCHKDLARTTDFPHPEKLAPVDCTSCHSDAVAAYNKSIHAAAQRQDHGSVAAKCVDCHTAHDIKPSTDPTSPTYPLNLPATCGKCHGNPAIIQQGHIQIGNVAALFKDSIHGKAISQAGLLVAPNCTTCHGNHDIRRATDPASPVFRTNIPTTCGKCHEGIEAQYGASIHGTALAAGNAKAPVCSDCHTAHSIQRTDVASWQLSVIRECGTCHAEKIRTYRDTFHGQVTSLGFVRVATCAACHTAHDIFPQSDPRSSVSKAHLLQTCQTCHPSATASFAEYDPHADRDNRAQNPTLYYAARFMKWLLVGVFGFFGLHALLWLPRGGLVRWRRHGTEPPAPDSSGETRS
jgi:nitrate/TMAO reductase-like tetraheme cytochrome c subunit